MAINTIKYNQDLEGRLERRDSDTRGGLQDKPRSILKFDQYQFSITSDVENASILVNNEPIGRTTPANYTIKKSELFKDDQRRVITVEKDGYNNNERYEIYIVSTTEIPLDELELYTDREGFLNLTDIDLNIDYYINDTLVPFDVADGVLVPLKFKLRSEVTNIPDKDDKRELTTILTGDNESAILSRVRDNKVLPINSNEETITDNQGTRYLLKSADTSLYRVGGIRITVDGETETIFAEDGQSLSTEITLNNDTQIEVITQRLVVREKRQPQIEIPNRRPRMLNKNEPTGIPIYIKKNPQVEAISVIIGEEMIEFDNLPPNQQCAITLPAKAFERLGSYNVKIFPYSIDQLKSFTRDTVEASSRNTSPIASGQSVPQASRDRGIVLSRQSVPQAGRQSRPRISR